MTTSTPKSGILRAAASLTNTRRASSARNDWYFWYQEVRKVAGGFYDGAHTSQSKAFITTKILPILP